MKRYAAACICTLAITGAAPATAGAHVLTEGTANAISERAALSAADRARASEYAAECERETPWTFSCNIQVYWPWRWCWQWFNVVQPNFGLYGRARIEDREPWQCEPITS